MNIPEDVVEKVSEKDLEQIQSELSPSERKTEAVPSTEKKTEGKASSEDATTQAKSDTAVSQETQKSASEGEKTLPSEISVRPKKSSYVPYDRFKEVNDKLKALEEELNAQKSQTRPLPPVSNELDNWGQPQPDVENLISQKVVEKVREVIEPIVTTLDEEREKKELEDVLEKYPDAKQYQEEIEAYGKATNLTYDDIATLVIAKHSKPVSTTERAKAEQEAREAEISGQSNSAAKRSFTPKDVKSLSDEELEELLRG